MKPVKQGNRHNPEKGIWGDCHSAVLASLLELHLEEVPHFAHGGPDGPEFHKAINKWLKTKGYAEVMIPFDSTLPNLLISMAAINPDVYYILGGTSKTGVDHSVICLNDKIIFDPSLNESGIIGPCGDGYYWVSFLISLRMVSNDSN